MDKEAALLKILSLVRYFKSSD